MTTAMFYLKRRAATLVLYAYKCVRKPIVVRGIKIGDVERVAGSRAGGGKVVVVRGRRAALAVAFLDEWKRRDVGDCVDRDLAKLYGKAFLLESEDVPRELWEIWQRGGLGAEVPPEVAAKTPPKLLRNFWGTYRLNEYPWVYASFVWR